MYVYRIRNVEIHSSKEQRLSSKLHGSKRANSVSLGEPFESTGQRRLIARSSRRAQTASYQTHIFDLFFFFHVKIPFFPLMISSRSANMILLLRSVTFCFLFLHWPTPITRQTRDPANCFRIAPNCSFFNTLTLFSS